LLKSETLSNPNLSRKKTGTYPDPGDPRSSM
jgi:hypothetical protein